MIYLKDVISRNFVARLHKDVVEKAGRSRLTRVCVCVCVCVCGGGVRHMLTIAGEVCVDVLMFR